MEKMLTRFESKSNRVKGMAFHPVRPWVLSSLHNGVIQLWDYRMGTLLDKFEEHEGPVRGVDFHRSQPIFVSGGDDYKVKVWDYKLRRCLFTLLGHLDYIRTVQFHVEYPWIVSASDDQTIRIWNWQSRSCISVLTGHNHYVMCASFHPKEDLIVSASLDQTVRVWDTTGLRKKTVRGAPPMMDDGNMVNRVNSELFGGNDAVVKFVLEGHERGVNWASFHPTLPLIVSGADDRQIKLWRMNETKAWEVDTLRGHTNNVSCVVFHPKQELIISNSEDRSIRVWDISKRLAIRVIRRDSDRFWILTVHPEHNLIAAGHDSGMFVFKLERERPAYDVVPGLRSYYVKDKYLRTFAYDGDNDIPLVSLRRSATTSGSAVGATSGYRDLIFNTFNKTEVNILLFSPVDGNNYELITISEGSPVSDANDFKRGYGLGGCFIGRDKMVILTTTKQLAVYGTNNTFQKHAHCPLNNVDGIFPGGVIDRVIVKNEEKVCLLDVSARRTIGELLVARVKYVSWKQDASLVAIMSKHQIVLADRNFEQLCTLSETVRVKGGCWDEKLSVFVYVTLNHVKYVLPNGDRGILRGLESPIYITRVKSPNLFYMDREMRSKALEIDTTEAEFKLALEKKNYGEVMRMVKHSRLCGQAVISYLQEKGYPEVALHFVTDLKMKFKLALACGNIQIAMNVAYELGDDAWRQLAVEALRQGNHEVVEMAYQKTKEFEKLSFLYLITGNTEKLRKMLKIAEMRNDVMSRFHNALYLGDAAERVKVLECTGQLSLAYLAAATHGLEEEAARLKELLVVSHIPIPDVPEDAELLQPPTPIYHGDNWPLLSITKSAFTDVDAYAAGGSNVKAVEEDDQDVPAGNWGDDDLFDDEEDRPAQKSTVVKEGGWGDDDLDLSDDEPIAAAPSVASYTAEAPGPSPASYWHAESSLAVDHLAAGSVNSALQLLNRQIAAADVSKLRSHAIGAYLASRAYIPGVPLTSSIPTYLMRDADKKVGAHAMPAICLKTASLLESLKQAYRAFTGAQFSDCMADLDKILHTIPLVVVPTKSEVNDIKELIDVCREYKTAIRVKNAMGETEDPKRSLELAAYFTHCNLQPAHIMLALKTAMAAAFKSKVFLVCIHFVGDSVRTSLMQHHLRVGCLNCPMRIQNATRTRAQRRRKCFKKASNKAAMSFPWIMTR